MGPSVETRRGIGTAVSDVASDRFVVVDPEFARIHGYTAGEMRGMPIRALYRPGDEGVAQRAAWATGRDGFHRFLTTHVRKDGSEVRVSVELCVVPDDAGNPVHRLGLLVDLEEEARARALFEGRARSLELLAAGAPLAAVLETITRMIERSSPSVRASVLVRDDADRLRTAAESSLPAFYNEAVDGLEIREGAGCCGTAAFRGERVIVADVASSPLWPEEYVRLARAADIRACWSEPVFSSAGRVIGTFAMYYRDPRKPTDDELERISLAARLAGIAIDQRRTLDALRAEEERYRTLVEHAAEAILVVDVASRVIVDANPKASSLLVRARDELVGTEVFRHSAADQAGRPAREVAGELLHAAVSRGVAVGEWVCRDSDGVDLPCELRMVRYPGERAQRVRVSLTDIRDRKRAEESRRLLDERARQVQRLESLGLLAGGVAHDFNNLLVGILGHSSLALMDLPEDSPARRSIEAVETAARRAADLAGEMLAYSGRARQERAPVDLARLVEETLPLIENVISRRARVVTRFAEGVPEVVGDATQLRQVVMNLVTNASEALGPSGGEIRVGLDLAVLDDDTRRHLCTERAIRGTYVALTVADQGCGIDDATRERIFDPFFSTRMNGRGLGLASVQGIVHGHDGAIVVESRPGEGATFKVLLPTAPIDLDGRVPDLGAEDVVAAPGSGTAIVVDDEPAVREFCAAALRRAGFEVVACADGEEALARARELGDLRVALVDLVMPGMGGDDVIRRLRRARPELPAILSSGYRRDEPAGFDGGPTVRFLAKPYTVTELLQAVARVTSVAPHR